jgi:diguanylate cyclase (GGDEF)-like protein
MSAAEPHPELTPAQLLAIIDTQTEIAKLGLDLSGVMTLVTEQAQAITSATGAVVEVAEGDEMVYRAVAGSASGQLGMRLKRATSLSGLCVASAMALCCDDSEIDPRVDREACRRVGLRSMLVVPLIHHGIAVGALKVYSPAVAAFGEGDMRALSLMSELIAASMFHSAKYGADELFRQATSDSLTGLANRALFIDRLRHGIAKARRESWLLGVVMLDVDGLKPINDRFGHRAGDEALQEVARRLKSEVRDSDTVARLGGDEFAILLWKVESHEAARAIARRIGHRCDGAFTFEGTPLKLGASLGLAIFPEDGDEADTLIEIADRRMYESKRARHGEVLARREQSPPARGRG